MITRSKDEIDEVLDWAYRGIEQGSSFPGMSYEEGISATLNWIEGHTDDRPDAD